jgi:hypothetical protein
MIRLGWTSTEKRIFPTWVKNLIHSHSEKCIVRALSGDGTTVHIDQVTTDLSETAVAEHEER